MASSTLATKTCARVDVGVELRGGVLGLGEQWAELAARAVIGLDPDPRRSRARPLRPRDDPGLRACRLVEHREVLELVPVGVEEVHGRRGHPADHARLVGLLAEERPRRDAGRAQRAAGAEHVLQRGRETRRAT